MLDTSLKVVPARREKVLQRGILAWEDPVCCCEAEPRWLRFEREAESPGEVSEWEALDRDPHDDL